MLLVFWLKRALLHKKSEKINHTEKTLKLNLTKNFNCVLKPSKGTNSLAVLKLETVIDITLGALTLLTFTNCVKSYWWSKSYLFHKYKSNLHLTWMFQFVAVNREFQRSLLNLYSARSATSKLGIHPLNIIIWGYYEFATVTDSFTVLLSNLWL